jgi:broad specificity phosphatase PhoE
MARLFLIRHGEPSGTWGDGEPDPGLTDLGRQQAQAAADRLRLLTPKQIVSSPLRRAYETSVPLAGMLGIQPTIAEAVGEIPTPANIELAHRGDWLRAVMTRNWSGVDTNLRRWRDGVVDYLTKLQTDTAVYSHFVAINVALGASIGDDRVVCFRPAHASITILETKGRVISLLEPGQTAETTVR